MQTTFTLKHYSFLWLETRTNNCYKLYQDMTTWLSKVIGHLSGQQLALPDDATSIGNATSIKHGSARALAERGSRAVTYA